MCRIHTMIEESLRDEVAGGLSLSTTKLSRAVITNVQPNQTNLEEEQWCEYSNMPSPSAYMND